MSILFLDTETTGLYRFRDDPDSPEQPHLVQLAAAVYDREGRIMSSLDVIVRPESWVIPEESAHVHGINQEKALQYGLGRRAVLAMFSQLCRISTCAVAFNMEFDENVLRSQFHREMVKPESFQAIPRLCAMRAATNVCKIPHEKANRSQYKWPSLMQAHEILLGKPFERAHNAQADMEALARVTFELVRLEKLDLP
jgi:DNA polymerase-3 subunit epsilon